ncbi:MAG: ECF RNA polymerase sigma factor SigK [Gordonia sp. (in: high G+C Gram-positive bacteria)]|uniref:ECF RNA polymerase sigma factor SigK n=1 Tax=Gordonia sp. (in: high G+C Gram-positive bacteria) TaxID=84139 RepID=UPI0039E64A6E
MTASTGAGLPHLLERAAGGDTAAFGEFYDETSARVYGMVLRVLRDPGYSEEVTQEVYLEAWRAADSYDPEAGSVLSWLLTIAHRRAVDRVRRETAVANRNKQYAAEAADREFDHVSEVVAARETTSQVQDCLDTLTDTQRQSVDLAYYHGLTYREVAERLSVALPTVKSRIRDGLIRLRKCLGDSDV